MKKSEERGQAVRENIMREITNYFILHGYAPSLKEISEAVGLKSTSTVAHHLDILIKEGKIETDASTGSSRAFRVKGMRVIFSDKA